ncbi:MAG: adenylosuccinate synthase [Thermomicrobiales bacterium]|nr:adenylosuccinate synthase [Thermomicrobiales bacterium]MCO5221218.1 adenylosuccinate synthase [Thermomicrobiales bacterium]
MPATIVLGGQWGDEGKGKITDALASSSGMVVRANGGSNAGHTISTPQGVFKMHLVPSGILSPGTTCVIGAGVVIDPIQLAQELQELRDRGIDTSALVISDRAHVVLPYHSEIDRGEERLRGEVPIGTTLRGIGPAYADKVSRRGMRIADLCDERTARPELDRSFDARNKLLSAYYESEEVDAVSMTEQLIGAAESLWPFVGHAEDVVQDALDRGERVIVECAQGAMLDIDYGSYPFVTSSSPTAAGACQGAGIAPNQVDRVIGVFKAYSSRVGSGPFPTELFDETGHEIRERGREYGTTTGRPRRVGWFDSVAARRVVRLNGVTEIALTLLDVLDGFDPIQVGAGYELDGAAIEHVPTLSTDYDRVKPILAPAEGWLEDTTAIREGQDLPSKARAYIDRIGALTGAPVSMVGVGPDRDQLVSVGRDIAAVIR